MLKQTKIAGSLFYTLFFGNPLIGGRCIFLGFLLFLEVGDAFYVLKKNKFHLLISRLFIFFQFCLDISLFFLDILSFLFVNTFGCNTNLWLKAFNFSWLIVFLVCTFEFLFWGNLDGVQMEKESLVIAFSSACRSNKAKKLLY